MVVCNHWPPESGKVRKVEVWKANDMSVYNFLYAYFQGKRMDTPTAPPDTLSNLKRAGSTPTMGKGKRLLVGIHVYMVFHCGFQLLVV